MFIKDRKIKIQFFNQIDKIIEWSKIDAEIKQYYKKGNSVDSIPSYS